MNDILKFIARLNRRHRKRIEKTIEELRRGEKIGKRLKGVDHIFGFRVGKLRIIYYRHGNDFGLHDIYWRDKIYKRLK